MNYKKRQQMKINRMVSEIREYVLKEGLDPFHTIFELVDYETMNELIAYGGFPKRFPHWTFGMDYEYHRQSYRYSLSRIYELVINTDPAHAFLLESNTDVDQKMVIAHVLAHSDFFKNNIWFSKTNRKMLDTMANHESIVTRYINKFGYETVEKFIDVCLSIEDLIDFHSLFIRRPSRKKDEVEREPHPQYKKLKVHRRYMDDFINPPEFLEAQRKQHERLMNQPRSFPASPEKDVLLFLLEHAPLENWQKVILSIIRDESYYFAPQKATKIMNEGWATYWHSYIMTHYVLDPSEAIDYADLHSGIIHQGPGRLNPYKLGYELWKDIEKRWNKGQFGPEWEMCDDREMKRKWDLKLGQGRTKMFEVRTVSNDLTFIDEYLTEDFCIEHRLFVYEYNKEIGMYQISSRKFHDIKKKLLALLTNFGKPVIVVQDGNYRNRSELYLKHQFDGIEIDIEYAKETLKNVYYIWKRPVHLETILQNRKRLLSYDGSRQVDVNIA